MGSQVKSLTEQLLDAQALLGSDDAELRNLAKDEVDKIKAVLGHQSSSNNDLIIEIRAGTGGDEAEIFAGQLLRMYQKYCEAKKWKFNPVETNRSQLGGIKSATVEIYGEAAVANLNQESGVHRVQRIPETEKKGRVHTSTVTVAVLPIVEEREYQIKPQDLRVDVYKAQGHGGQGVNTTDSAVRITHLPTGIVVTCQDERSQIKNRDKAVKVLRAKLASATKAIGNQELSDTRRTQIGTGDRSEKIRTYNFPQDRVTDHRVKKSWSKIERILDGELGPVIKSFENIRPLDKSS